LRNALTIGLGVGQMTATQVRPPIGGPRPQEESNATIYF
jgi:hypothetical protein